MKYLESMIIWRASCCTTQAGKQDLKVSTVFLQIVLTVLGTWGVVIYGSLKIFGGKKQAAPPGEAQTVAAH